MSPTSNEERASIRYVHDTLLDIVRKKDIASLFRRCDGTILAARNNKYKRPDNLDLDLLFVIPKYLNGEGESLVAYTSRIIDMLPEDVQEGARRLAAPKARVAEITRQVELAANRKRTVVSAAISSTPSHDDSQQTIVVPNDVFNLASPYDREETLAPENVVFNTSLDNAPQKPFVSNESLLDDVDQMLIDDRYEPQLLSETAQPKEATQREARADLKLWLYDNDIEDIEDILLRLGATSYSKIRRLAKTTGTGVFAACFLENGGNALQYEFFCDALSKTTTPRSA
ncbi:hypothetical protein CALVIDRAFT_597850 [Calocera viscosa TUFC12733]|uniref:Uncharacterized protein n=1 Tax=Calocera viscosa (strain TUFC12733) TaxID=1330018 RepID=A0A167MWN6_CALVF|nr:hypothetical protein CALVIDRAFT_597850 [Calocera viscosa TUFC12733]